MDNTSQHTHVSISIGDNQYTPSLKDGATCIIRMVDDKPTLIEFDGASWNAFSEAVTGNLDEFLTSGNEEQREAYSLFQQTLPENARQGQPISES